ncbi:tetratricopeptide repeat protein [Candidatus Tisiphia endosymbiont of Piscicola geometra]|uniref:tetratricopeptide repeat protein n=1 Tax=Candidatus Tisiphia endosymbiont of Piscicola geometra TaxID=3066273 RepID=UPI00312CA584
MKKYILIIMVLIMPYTSVAQVEISNLVIPVSYFVDHVKQLTLVKNNSIKYRQTSLVGISGMGKTQLARMYAYENKNNYELIWFIDCSLDINEGFLKLAKSINEKAKTNLISEDVRTAKKEVLSYLSSKNKWLLVFDNLKIKENHKVQEFVNWEHNGHVIFASQDSELLPNTVKMTAFEKNDATTLANNILEKDDPKLAEFLVQEFSGYPILIVQGTQLLNQVPGLNQEEYKKRIRDSTDKIKLNINLAIKELKPNAKRLLNKIALINTQGFSKELLKIITDDKNTIDDDIYQLSKFALISNTDPNETNPVFEMHDVIANKIMEINGNKNNRDFLEDIIQKIPKYKDLKTGHLWRISKTIPENLEVLLKNSEKYNINVYSILDLRAELFTIYVNTQNGYKAQQMMDWFEQKDKRGEFKFWLMSAYQKYCYGRYLGLIGIYNRISLGNFEVTISYATRALEILDNLKIDSPIKFNLDAQRLNLNAHIAGSQASLVNTKIAEEIIEKIEESFTQEVQEVNIFIIYFLKSKLLFIQGKYTETLEQIGKLLVTCIQNGMDSNDLLLTHAYLIKSEVLSILGKYKEAYVQAEQLYDMHKLVKKKDHEVFGQIFTEMSRAELGLGNIRKALEYAQKAKNIFINDPTKKNVNLTELQDLRLAKAFVVEGDALAALGQNEKAAESYASAEVLYYNNYRDNMKNIDEVSYLYWAAAKATCNLPNKFWYIKFSTQLIEKFGENHFRSIELLSKCKN